MKLQEQMRQKIKLQGKSRKTYETYWQYCQEFLLFLKSHRGEWVHPSTVGRSEIEQWLTYKAVNHCSKNTQNTALQSVLYLYREILGAIAATPSGVYNATKRDWRLVVKVLMGKHAGQIRPRRSLTGTPTRMFYPLRLASKLLFCQGF
jgi:site-specific recombinase XerD